jgi:hypothetical protein
VYSGNSQRCDGSASSSQPSPRIIDLARRFRQDWIGDWNDTYRRQQRTSAYGQPKK